MNLTVATVDSTAVNEAAQIVSQVAFPTPFGIDPEVLLVLASEKSVFNPLGTSLLLSLSVAHCEAFLDPLTLS